jgi:small multidrug resistance pump
VTSYLYLSLAIATEVTATLALKVASGGRVRWYWFVGTGYLTSFAMLSMALAAGLAIGVAYGIWVAVGVAVTVIGSKFIFGEPFTAGMAGGVALIILGVLFIELGAPH